MSTSELRKSIHDYIENADERFLRMVYSMANEYTKSDSEIIAFRAGKAISKNQLYKELKESEQEIENGDYMTIEEFDKQSSQWK
jgi:5'-3' exonuclease